MKILRSICILSLFLLTSHIRYSFGDISLKSLYDTGLTYAIQGEFEKAKIYFKKACNFGRSGSIMNYRNNSRNRTPT